MFHLCSTPDRVLDIAFNPGSALEWHIHGAVRHEGARLWARIVTLHASIRRRNGHWPNKGQLEKWAKGKFPGLHSQSVQKTIVGFLEAVESTRQKRKNLTGKDDAKGLAQAHYPWKTSRYRPVTFTNQAPRRKGNRRVLPCGKVEWKRAYLSVPLPKGFVEPGRLMEVRLAFCSIALVFAIPGEDKVSRLWIDRPRDVVGALNIRTKGLQGEIQKVCAGEVPQIITYRRVPVRGPCRRSAGHAARRSDLQPLH